MSLAFTASGQKNVRQTQTYLGMAGNKHHAAILALAGFSLLPLSATAADGIKGEALFRANCSSCHKGGSNAIAKERTLNKEALEKFLGLESKDDISNFVRNSNVHRGALVFSGRMTADDYDDVAAYIYSQAVDGKW